MIKFFKDGTETFVIVDDYLPVREDGLPALTRGGPDGKEMWPCILEKAYAKFYGNYSYIEAGKIQMALSDMLNGFPDQILLKPHQDNPSIFIEILKGLVKVGAYMGAGSPENALGDSAISKEGIVQGHAYAVL